MTQEEKARAYDEALARAKDMMSYKEVRREDMEYLFPELKKSEDEKIRKELLAVVNDLVLPSEQQSRFVTWLEKQGKFSPILSDSSNIGKNTWSEEDERIRKALITYFQRFPYDSLEDAGINAKDAIAWLESKSAPETINEPVDNADKVEPKFKPGDWVIRKDGDMFSNGSISACVQRIEGHNVWFEHGTYSNEWVLKKITN